MTHLNITKVELYSKLSDYHLKSLKKLNVKLLAIWVQLQDDTFCSCKVNV